MLTLIVCLMTAILISLLVILIAILYKRRSEEYRRYHSLVVVNGGKPVRADSAAGNSLLYDEIAPDNTIMVNVNVTLEKETENKSFYILTLTQSDTGQSFQASFTDYLLVGRENSDEHRLCINYMGISRTHCRFRIIKGYLYVEDMDSTNHTYLNDMQVTEKEPVQSGDIVYLGSIPFVVDIVLQ